MTALVVVPDTTQLTVEARQLVADANALSIVNATSYAAAAEFGKGIKALQKKIVDFLAPMKKKSHAAWKQVCDTERSELAPTEEAERVVKSKMLDWQRKENIRIAEETRRREELARKQEEERRMQEALDLDADGDRKGAEEVLSQPIETPVVAAPHSAAPKISGVAPTKRWTFDLDKIDMDAVLCHIVGVPVGTKLAHPELRRILTIDSSVVRPLVTAMRENFSIPGIQAYEAEGLSLGSK